MRFQGYRRLRCGNKSKSGSVGLFKGTAMWKLWKFEF